MIQILDIVRDLDRLEDGKELMKISYSGAVPSEEIFVEIQLNGTTHDGFIVDHDAVNELLWVREIPFKIGVHEVKLIQSSGNSSVFNYMAEANDTRTGAAFNLPINLRHSKMPIHLVSMNEVKGGHHAFESMFDFLYFPRDVMQPTMTASVLCDDDIIRTYSLNWVDPATLPWPLKDSDVGEPGSFRNYWKLQSEARAELPFVQQVEYAPDFNGGIPPFFENPDVTGNFDRYVFPEGAEWDDERDFTATKWASTQSTEHAWKRVTEESSGVKSRPIAINADPSLLVQENRFIRAFEKPSQEGSDISIYSYYKGKVNKFATFDMYGRVFSFSDRQPAKRAWTDLTQEEQDAYEAKYGTVVDGTSQDVVNNINKLYMTLATKDIYGNLRSAWSEPVLLVSGDGNLVRYSADGKGDINKVREQIIQEGITDQAEINTMYEDIGWFAEYIFEAHNYMAYRASTAEPWEVRQTGNELGQYTKDFYKYYPINYYDRITNIRTRGNYTPIGVNAKNNPEDDITESNWTDGIPETAPPAGFELYRATMVLSFDNSKVLGEPTITLFSGRSPLVDFISSDKENFKTVVENTANGSADTVTRDITEINLIANLFKDNEDVFAFPGENIKFVWRRIFNAGAPDSTVVFNNFGKTYDVETNTFTEAPETLVEGADIPTGFTVTNAGKNIAVDHEQVDSSAIFELTIWRDVAGNLDFEGTGAEWISYKSEKTLGDIVDRVVRSVVVSAEKNQFFYKGTSEGNTLVKSDFIGGSSINIKAFAANVDYTNGSWYVWNKVNDYEALKEASTPAEWKAIEASTSSDYWTDLNDTDLNRNVLWNSDGFETPEVTYNVYKFHALTPKGTAVYDITTIAKTKDGVSARDIKLTPEQFAIPLASDGLSFDGVARKTFKVAHENIDAPSFNWELLDKNDNVVATKTGATFVFEGNAAAATTGEDYIAADIDTVKNLSPFTVRVTETSTGIANFIEEGIIVTLLGGNLAVKGDEGEGGLQVVYDPNDLVPSKADGTPIGTVSESTTVSIYKGSVAQPIGVGPGEFSVELSTIPAGVTASAAPGSNVINVSGLTSNNKDVILFKIKENGTNYIVDGQGNEVEFSYTLTKSKAGEAGYGFILSNESQIFNIDSEGVLRTFTLDGVTNAIAKTSVKLFKGADEISLAANEYSYKINGDDVVTEDDIGTQGSAGAYTNLRAANLSTSKYDYPFIRVNKDNGNIYVRFVGEDYQDVPDYIEVDIIEPTSGRSITKVMTLTSVLAPKEVRRVQIVPRTGTAFYPGDADTKELVFDVSFLEGLKLVDQWEAPTVKINGVEKLNKYLNGVLRIKKSDTTQNTAVTVESGGAVAFIQIVDVEEAEGIAVLYSDADTLTTGASNTSLDPFASLGAPLGTEISYAEVKEGTVSFSKVSNGNTWKKDSTNAKYATWRAKGDSYWSAPFKQKGEKGDKGASLIEVPVYKSAASKPSKPSGLTLPPTGWSLTIPESGKIWSSKRTYEFVGDGNGDYGVNSQYKAFTGSSWSDVYRTTGDPGSYLVFAYIAGSAIQPEPPLENTLDSLAAGPWSQSIEGTGATSTQYIWVSQAYFTHDGLIVGEWEAAAVQRFPQAADGDQGEPGEPGEGVKVYYGGQSPNNTHAYAKVASYAIDFAEGQYQKANLKLGIMGDLSSATGYLTASLYTNSVDQIDPVYSKFTFTQTAVLHDGSPYRSKVQYFHWRLVGNVFEVWVQYKYGNRGFHYSNLGASGSYEWTFYENNEAFTTTKPTGLTEFVENDLKGDQGIKGDPGVPGATGPQGPKGDSVKTNKVGGDLTTKYHPIAEFPQTAPDGEDLRVSAIIDVRRDWHRVNGQIELSAKAPAGSSFSDPANAGMFSIFYKNFNFKNSPNDNSDGTEDPGDTKFYYKVVGGVIKIYAKGDFGDAPIFTSTRHSYASSGEVSIFSVDSAEPSLASSTTGMTELPNQNVWNNGIVSLSASGEEISYVKRTERGVESEHTLMDLSSYALKSQTPQVADRFYLPRTSSATPADTAIAVEAFGSLGSRIDNTTLQDLRNEFDGSFAQSLITVESNRSIMLTHAMTAISAPSDWVIPVDNNVYINNQFDNTVDEQVAWTFELTHAGHHSFPFELIPSDVTVEVPVTIAQTLYNADTGSVISTFTQNVTGAITQAVNGEVKLTFTHVMTGETYDSVTDPQGVNSYSLPHRFTFGLSKVHSFTVRK